MKPEWGRDTLLVKEVIERVELDVEREEMSVKSDTDTKPNSQLESYSELSTLNTLTIDNKTDDSRLLSVEDICLTISFAGLTIRSVQCEATRLPDTSNYTIESQDTRDGTAYLKIQKSFEKFTIETGDKFDQSNTCSCSCKMTRSGNSLLYKNDLIDAALNLEAFESKDDITIKTGDKFCQSNTCYGEASHNRMMLGNKSETGNKVATSLIESKAEDKKHRFKINENRLF